MRKYQGRISGPLLDRIDMYVQVPRLRPEDRSALLAGRRETAQGSRALQANVRDSRDRQLARTGKINAFLDQAQVRQSCRLQPEDEGFLTQAMQHWQLSARGVFRVLKMARTIADLEGAGDIRRHHLQEAMTFRSPRHRDG